MPYGPVTPRDPVTAGRLQAGRMQAGRLQAERLQAGRLQVPASIKRGGQGIPVYVH